MKRLLFAVAAAALTLSACETATPYQPLRAHSGHTSGGYSEQQIEPNRWNVTFSGNSATERQTVEKYLLFRAAEVTTQHGYDWFTTVDRHTERKDSYYDTGFGGTGFGPYGYGYGFGGGYFSPYWGLYSRGRGWGYGYGAFGAGYWGGGFGGGGFDIQQVSQYQAGAEILMGRGPKPANDRHAFDARAVQDHLRPTLELPKA